MKKICPYCSRSGEIGETCVGCGYVFREEDKPAITDTTHSTLFKPEPETAPVVNKIKAVFVKISTLVGWVTGIGLIFFGLTGILVFYDDYITKSDRITMMILGFIFVLLGLLVIRKLSFKSMKVSFWRYLPYLICLSVVAFFVSIFI